eukprot:c19278_g1_i6.p1 GENE.c19278_g1_i6~~c19278_g1_i6.p1  ORF type:complete len:981 (+),score=126.05 c19278_g1_i6:419-2944(+)
MTSLLVCDFSGNALSGTIPSQIGNMAALSFWFLQFNDLTGTIPSEIGMLSNLEIWQTDYNPIEGTIPSQIAHLKRLLIWNMVGNRVGGSLPSQLGQATSLERWLMARNRLTGTIPVEIQYLTNLVAWDLIQNRISGTIPSEVAKLTNLELWLFESNRLSGPIPTQVGLLTKLICWTIATNKLTGTIPTETGHLSNLVYWNLIENALEGRVPTQVGQLTAMLQLRFTKNRLSGAFPSQIANLNRLIGLYASDNRFSGSIPLDIWKLPALRTLDFAYNRISGTIPSSLSHKIQGIVLHQNRITGQIPSQIALLTDLQFLSLFNNRLQGSLPELFVPQLLLLFNNFLSCELPQHIANNASRQPHNHLTFIAFGNSFQLDWWWNGLNAAWWLHRWDSKSIHMFEEYPRPWAVLTISFACCVLIYGVVGTGPSVPYPYLWKNCKVVCTVMGAVVSIYLGILVFSPHLYKCSSLPLRLTLAEVTSTHGMFFPILACVVVHFICSIVALKWLGKSSTLPVGTQSPWSEALPVGIGRRIVIGFAWIMTICLLHFPVLIGESFPANNSFGDPFYVLSLRYLVSPWLFVTADLIVPRIGVWFTEKYYAGPSPLHKRLIEMDRPYHSPKFRTVTEMILVSQLVVLVVAPVISHVIFHDKCMGLARLWWEPCRGNNDLFETLDNHQIDFEFFVSNVTTHILTQQDVCGHRWDSEICARSVITATSITSVSKVIYQTLTVLVRALFVTWLRSRATSFRGHFGGVLRRLAEPKEDSVTRSILSLTLLGFTYGAVSPLIWPAVLFCMYSLTLLWRCSQQEVTRKSRMLVGSPVMWTGIFCQFGLANWFVTTILLQL